MILSNTNFILFIFVGLGKIIKVNGLDPLCKWYSRRPGKCSPDGNMKCHAEVQVERTNQKFERCECTNHIIKKKDHHDCNCFVKPPCRQP